jgi:hypothetical protein
MVLIGVDFSCNKPACCIKHNDKYKFIIWPLEMDEKSIKALISADITVTNRERLKDGFDSSEKIRNHVKMAERLAYKIMNEISPIIQSDPVMIAFEGSSFSSKGDAGLQLAGYKYVLMHELGKFYDLDNVYTYAPLTIKSFAGCATKDKRGKESMIQAFIEKGPDCKFKETLRDNPIALKKKTSYVPGVDDLVDAYFVLETLRAKIEK